MTQVANRDRNVGDDQDHRRGGRSEQRPVPRSVAERECKRAEYHREHHDGRDDGRVDDLDDGEGRAQCDEASDGHSVPR